MNRKQYITYRWTNNLGEVVLFHFESKKGKVYTRLQFSKLINLFIKRNRNVNLKELWKLYDNKFELQLLLDKKGKILKIY